MIKRLYLILFLLLISNSNFLFAKEIKPGITITKENYKEYLSELNDLIPKPFLDFYIIPALDKGLLKMPIVEPKKYMPYFGYEEWAKKNKGVCKLGPKGELLNWKAGAPFPDPKSGLELAWDLNMTQWMEQGSYNPMRWYLFENLFKKERVMDTKVETRAYKGRTYLPQVPEITPNPENIWWKTLTSFTYPFDAKGFSIVRIRYMDPKNPDKEDDSWAYLPTLRRIRRFSGADNQDPLLGSDLTLDDYSVMAQRLDTRIMDFKLEEKVCLVPERFDYQKLKNDDIDRENGVCIPPGWAKKVCYVLEIKIKDPTYMYSKRIIYTIKDALLLHGNSPYLIRLDQRGRPWRIQMNIWHNIKGNEKGNYDEWIMSPAIDCQTKHQTLLEFVDQKSPDTSIKADDFELRRLIKGSR